MTQLSGDEVYEENLETLSMQGIQQGIEKRIERCRREGFEKASRRGLKCLLELKLAQAAALLIARLPDPGLRALELLQDAL